MPKQRMSIDDISAMTQSIRSHVLNMRVTNIYNLNNELLSADSNQRTYIFKLHQPPFPKTYLLIESGLRFHTSKYARIFSSSKTLPNSFTMKLRKHLRGKRLTGLRQLEGDRVLDFSFNNGAFHLILELYVSGNIILTDEEYTVLSLLRTQRADANVKLAVHEKYPLEKLMHPSPKAEIRSYIEIQSFFERLFRQIELDTSSKASKKRLLTMKQLLLSKNAGMGNLGPALLEHCIVSSQIPLNLKVNTMEELKALGEERVLLLFENLRKSYSLLDYMANSKPETETKDLDFIDFFPDFQKVSQGYIILGDSEDKETYEDFAPFLYAQHQNKKHRHFSTFDEAVDEYFSKLETQKAEIASQNAEVAANARLEKIKRRQQMQLTDLQKAEKLNHTHAQLIELHQQDIDNVILVIRSALASGMDWKDLGNLVKHEQQHGNPIANLIHVLDLNKNRVSVLLCDEEETEDSKKEMYNIWIDLSLSALGNAARTYAQKKKAASHATKAEEATEMAIKSAAAKANKTILKQRTAQAPIFQRRKIYWFEKFHWFLSSENYLVVGGKDAQQNEMLVRRYLRKGDVFVHADVQGAPICIIRSRTEDEEIPIATLEQAGCLCVCRSKAWGSQVITGAYYVRADQVIIKFSHKSVNFSIRGEKQILQPPRLEMGLAIVFLLDKEVEEEQMTADGSQIQSDRTLIAVCMEEDTIVEEVALVTEDIPQASESIEQDEQAPAPAKIVRGKKGKLKKMKKKYADQDEEDRLLRMEALGHCVKKVSKKEIPASAPTKASIYIEPGTIKLAQQRKEQFLKEEEVAADMLQQFDAFTGSPNPQDPLIAVIPMCAPYSSLVNYTYRVKLTPGSLKSGKAAKQAIHHFLALNMRLEKGTEEKASVQRQRELMRSVIEHEIIQCAMGSVRMSAPGGILMQADGKKVKNRKK